MWPLRQRFAYSRQYAGGWPDPPLQRQTVFLEAQAEG